MAAALQIASTTPHVKTRYKNLRRCSRHQGQSWPNAPPQNSEWSGTPFAHTPFRNYALFSTTLPSPPGRRPPPASVLARTAS